MSALATMAAASELPWTESARFVELAATCDDLLRAGGRSVARLANPWLHPISAHPHHMARYASVLGIGEQTEEYKREHKEIVRGARDIVLATLHGVPADLLATRCVQIMGSNRPRAIIVSHLVNAAHLDLETDFYFGSLQLLLDDRGIDSLVLLINHTGTPGARLAERVMRHGPKARALLPGLLDSGAEVRLWRTGNHDRRALKGAAHDQAGSTRRIIEGAAAAATASTARFGLRLHAQVAAIVERVRPALFFSTHEGHAWERCVWLAAAQSNNPPLRIGYQHTVLLPHSHGARRSLREVMPNAAPDLLWTTGEATRDMLAASEVGRTLPLEVYGTHRPIAGKTRNAEEHIRRCLVLPEGLETECVVLFRFALACARLAPHCEFVFRTHPVMPYERVAAQYSELRDLPANVSVSREPALEQDLSRCGSCLYRGSSTVVYAVLSGLRPIYVKTVGEPLLDPLFALPDGGWRACISAPEGFSAIVNEPCSPALTDSRLFAVDYCSRYSVPVRVATLDRALQAAHSRGDPAISEETRL